jgi:di/tricarboxylate transporter
MDAQRVPTPKELVEEYRLPDQLLRLRVRRGSAMIGKTVAQTDLGRNFGVVVLQILRSPEPRPSFQFARSLGQAVGGRSEEVADLSGGDATVQLDDVLVVKGDPDDVAHAAAQWNLGVQPAAAKDEQALIDREVGVAEVVLPRRSRLVGKTLVEERFGSAYKLTVLNIQRPGVHEALELGSTRLAFGDILLVQGPWEQIAALKERRRDFVVVGQPEAMVEAPRKEKANVALLILVVMVEAMIAGVASLTAVAMVAGLVMVLSGCLTMDEAYEFIDWRSLFLIAGMIPLSTALENAGVVDFAAQGLVQSLGSIGPLAVLAGLFLFTSAFTQVISNTATTVIVAPLAVASASQLGVQPYAFLMAIAVAASMAFATPVASPTNTLVMGAGHYTFGDYARVGLPLILIALVEVVLVLPLLFPFN